jgi:roadblock/LC7 domain-containing protein
LENVVLVDTPDMDSTQSEKFHPLLEKIISVTDVLVCVLSAENPKRRDTIVFLKRFVDFFPGHLLYVVLNRCDRIAEEELKQVVLPDLHAHLHSAWHRPVETVLCVSARSQLQKPDWPEDETPLHGFDEYRRLQDLIFGSAGQGRRFVDARVERAEHLAALIRKSASYSLAGVKDRLVAVRQDILAMEKKAAAAANLALREAGAEMMTGIQAMFYQKLAGRWWGPVGWLLAFWARFLMAGAGMMAALRIGNPVIQIWGLVSALVRYRKTRSAVADAAAGGDMAPVLLKYRFTVQQSWPEIAQKLVALGFDASVRDTATVLPEKQALSERLADSWKATLEAVMDRRAAGVSGFFLQLVFNLPTLAIMGLFAYQSVDLFLRQQILPSGYFLHATVSILLVWLLSFVLLQVIVRFVSGKSLLDKTLERLFGESDHVDGEPLSRSIIDEIDTVLHLGD